MSKLRHGKLKVLMTVGQSHGDLVRKAGKFGIRSKVSYPEKLTNQSKWYPRIMEQGFITDDSMEEMI